MVVLSSIAPSPPTASVSWSWIWKIRAPEKVRVFMWLLSHDVLQVNKHRFHCHLASSPTCPHCSHVMEDILHCLRDCPSSREVWFRLGAFTWPRFRVANARDWVRFQVQGQHSTLFVAALWVLWCWQNVTVLGDNNWSIEDSLRRIRRDAEDHDCYLASRLHSLHVETNPIVWRAPPPPRVSAN